MVAAVGIAALVAAVLAGTPASAAPATVSMATAPVSGTLVPGLRGKAAADASAYVAEKFRQQADARTADLPPWTGSRHTGFGVFPFEASNGAQATHSVDPDIQIPSGNPDVIYAPTLDPSGKTCIEVTTYYWQGGNAVGAWDWCADSPGFAMTRGIDANFISTYTTTVDGQPAYTVRDVQTDATTNSWTAYLYNFTTGAWDELYTSANTSKLSETHGGWNMYEVYTEYDATAGEGYYCAETVGSTWFATDMQVRFGSTWESLSPANSQISPNPAIPADFGCEDLTFSVPTANSTWRVTH